MQRPTAVTVFGILNIVFAALGVVGMVASLMLFGSHAGANNPIVQLIHDKPAYALYVKFSTALEFVACGLLLAAGIGLLMLKPWARVLSIFYGVYAIVMGVVGMAVNFFYLVQPMIEQARQKQGPEAAAAIGGAVGGTIGGCFGLIYPVLLLVFMTRPKIVAAFRPTQG